MKSLLVLSSLLLGLNAAVAQLLPARPPQYVLLSFDGSLNLQVWQKLRKFTQQQKDAGKDIRFTFFASGVYFLHPGNKTLYKAPQHGAGKSAIGFGVSPDDIAQRIDQVNLAFSEGHEIGSHANGHFDGGDWSHAEWSSEFGQFNDLIFNVFANNKIDPNRDVANGWLMNRENIVGFRAPLLAENAGMFQTLKDFYFTYDCSKTASSNYWPQKNQHGTWNFPLASLKIVGSGKKTLSMDYNFYVAQSGASPKPENKEVYKKEMYDTYLAWFQQNYNGSRAPLNIGHHFSMWNGGAYWEAMSQFATKVCGMPEVKCVTYSEYVEFLEGLTPQVLGQYSKGQFEKAMPIAVTKHLLQAIPPMSLMTTEDLNDPALQGDLPEAHFEEGAAW